MQMGLCSVSKVLEAVGCTKAPVTMADTVGECETSRGSGLQTYDHHVIIKTGLYMDRGQHWKATGIGWGARVG